MKESFSRWLPPLLLAALYVLAGAPVVSCQFQTISLLPAKMFRGRGKGGEAANPANFASGNTQYELTQASTLPGQGVSPLTRWGGCPQPANGLCPLTPTGRCAPVPSTKGLPPSVLLPGEADFHRLCGFCQLLRL